jgi:hypothetical protein
MVSTAWALRRLAVPETLPAVLEYVQREHKRLLGLGKMGGRANTSAEAVDAQLSQLVQFLGQANYRPADAALRALVPRFLSGQPPLTPVRPETRAAACWALGLMHEGTPVPELIALFVDRLTDTPAGPPGPENSRVRYTSAIALGRMKAQEALPALRKYYPGLKPSRERVGKACAWAVSALTGEKMPEPGVIEDLQQGWFLMPAP